MTNEIKGYCNEHFYTDVHPYEVVKVISGQKSRGSSNEGDQKDSTHYPDRRVCWSLYQQ